jgi:HSP20 family molecular chaperone IbpA
MTTKNELTKHEDGRQPEQRWRNVVPVCDVYENPEEYLIVAEVPGVDEQGIDVRLDRTRLSIEARRRHGDNNDAVGTCYTRVFEVPATIEASRISAKLSEGLLSLHLPKAPEARVRQIAVTAG